jgi:chorismate mutase
VADSEWKVTAELHALRSLIDQLDDVIAKSMVARITIARRVQSMKREAGAPALDGERERAIVERIASDGALARRLVVTVWRSLFTEVRSADFE